MTERTRYSLLALAGIAALIALNHWAFARWAGTGYVAWYVANGAQIGFLSSLIGLAWGSLDRNPALVSANPGEYVVAALYVVGLPMGALGNMIGKSEDERGPAEGTDRLLGALIGFALALGLLVWLVVIAPLQYVAFLVCGARARAALRSSERPIARFVGGQLETKRIGPRDTVPTDWWDASLGQKPFAFTCLVQGLGFFVWKLAAG
jgi:hypothetical protein